MPTPIDLEVLLAQWRQEQDKVASRVVVLDDPPRSNGRYKVVSSKSDAHPSNELYGGVDVSFPECDTDPAVAVYVILRGNDVVYEDHVRFDLQVPYVSSYLSFREIGPLERLVRKQIEARPDLTPRAILVDGNGVLHVRRAGIACFLGVRTGVATIGVGKKLYCHQEAGLTHDLVDRGVGDGLDEFWTWCKDNPVDSSRLASDRGLILDQECIDGGRPTCAARANAEDSSSSRAKRMRELVDNASSVCSGYAVRLRGTDGTVWGAALLCHGGRVAPWAKPTQNPIFVSVGHNFSLEEAVRVCSELSNARIPEPIRVADLKGRELMRDDAGDASTCCK